MRWDHGFDGLLLLITNDVGSADWTWDPRTIFGTYVDGVSYAAAVDGTDKLPRLLLPRVYSQLLQPAIRFFRLVARLPVLVDYTFCFSTYSIHIIVEETHLSPSHQNDTFEASETIIEICRLHFLNGKKATDRKECASTLDTAFSARPPCAQSSLNYA